MFSGCENSYYVYDVTQPTFAQEIRNSCFFCIKIPKSLTSRDQSPRTYIPILHWISPIACINIFPILEQIQTIHARCEICTKHIVLRIIVSASSVKRFNVWLFFFLERIEQYITICNSITYLRKINFLAAYRRKSQAISIVLLSLRTKSAKSTRESGSTMKYLLFYKNQCRRNWCSWFFHLPRICVCKMIPATLRLGLDK